MKQIIKTWLLRLTALMLFITALLLIIILNPVWAYAHKTTHNNYTVFHAHRLDPGATGTLDAATALVKQSVLYDPQLQVQICMNDGYYPGLIRSLRGNAFAWGFYNKVVLQGTADFENNYLKLHGYKWNLTQLLAHEITHCMQFNQFGLWNSNPVANIPDWKWEGYAEYVARQYEDQKDLVKNITRLADATQNTWEITLADGTIAPRQYYNYWMLVQFCLDIKKMTYKQVLSDTSEEETIRQEMTNWYNRTNL